MEERRVREREENERVVEGEVMVRLREWRLSCLW